MVNFENNSAYLDQDQQIYLQLKISEIEFYLVAITNRITSITILKKTRNIFIMKTVSDQLVQMISFLEIILASQSNSTNVTQSSANGVLLSNLISNYSNQFFLTGNSTINSFFQS